MARVFISHASADAAVAEQVFTWLIEDGHEAFLDRDLRAGIMVGEDWDARLHERLRWADAVVCVVTSAFLRSAWCSAEVAIARSRGSRLLPLLAEHGVDHPLLRSLQHADYTESPGRAREAMREALQASGRARHHRLVPARFARPLDRFVGRRAELEELRGILAGTRLMTLTGPGGCGKTRLALELAAGIQAQYASGVAFVELASVRDPTAVRESVAQALGLPGEASERMATLVEDASLLLVVDNVEHLLDAVSTLVQELLTGCPNLTVLATSRELLDVAGEVSWRVPPLRLPPAPMPGVAADVAGVASCDSVPSARGWPSTSRGST